MTAVPQMALYIKYSTDIYNIYLKYFAPEDIHVYSIDEVFIDATSCLALYKTGARELAVRVIHDVLDATRITEVDEISYRKKLWSHRPLTDFWRVGNGTASRLEKYFLYTMGDIARLSLKNPKLLYKEFGIDAEILIDHAWGVEPVGMKEIKGCKTQAKSL